MYDKQARREKYLRKKNNVLKKCCNEEYEAYRKIKEKFLLNDYEIKELLMSYTVTEILEGEFEENKFIPKELIKIFAIILFIFVVIFGFDVKAEKVMTYEGENTNVFDSIFK